MGPQFRTRFSLACWQPQRLIHQYSSWTVPALGLLLRLWSGRSMAVLLKVVALPPTRYWKTQCHLPMRTSWLWLETCLACLCAMLPPGLHQTYTTGLQHNLPMHLCLLEVSNEGLVPCCAFGFRVWPRRAHVMNMVLCKLIGCVIVIVWSTKLL